MYNDSLKRIAASWAQDEAARRLAEEQARAQAQQNQPTGLGAVLAGIGRSIGNVGESLYNIGGTGVAAIRDIFTGNAGTGKYQDEWKQYRKEQMGDKGMSDSDYYLKQGGQALDAAATVSDFIPGLGKGAKVALNVAQGGASGIGQTLQDKGASATAEDLLKSGAVGLASAGAGQAVGGALAKNALTNPAKGIIGKAAQSGIGRGAITGAVSGATGGTLGTALNGGDLGQSLSGALQGAGSGALGGAATSAIYGLAGAGLNKVKNKIENGPLSPQAQLAAQAEPENELPAATKKRQTATNWNDEPVDASKRNALQKLGKTLQDTGEITENNDIYGRLNNNTARDVQKRGTVKNLKDKYGYTSSDYDKAGELSTAANHFVKQEAQMSGASGYDTDLVNRVSINADDVPEIQPKTLKSYRAKSQQLLQNAKVDGGGVDEYSVAGLYDSADAANKLANSYYEKSHNKMDGSVTNVEYDALSKAYGNLKNELRTAADNMLGGEIDDVTRNNLVKMLESSGAPTKAVKTLSSAKSFKELIRLTSPLEEARNMSSQMIQSQLKRGATTDSSKANVLNEALRASGVPQAVKTVAAPAGQIVGKAEQVLGKGISKVGDMAAGKVDTIPGKIVAGIANAPSTINQGMNTGLGDVAIRQISRQAGLGAMRSQDAQKQAINAQDALSEAQTAYNTAANNYAVAQQAAATTPAQTAGVQQLERIKTAMDLALAAGDISSYSKLADLYTTAYKIYGADTGTTSKLTTKQQSALDEANNSLSMVDQLEAAFNRAGGGQGAIMGNVSEFTNWLTGGGANAGLSSYNALKQSLGTSIVKNVVNLGGTEADAQRYLAMLPSATDTPELAAQKLNELRTMLNNMKANIGSTS